jgi:hypothetical protein
MCPTVTRRLGAAAPKTDDGTMVGTDSTTAEAHFRKERREKVDVFMGGWMINEA